MSGEITMLRGLLGLGLVFVAASTGLAFGQAAGSENGPPTQQVVRIDSSGQLQVYYLVSVCIPETQTRTITQFVDVQEEFTEEVDGAVVKKVRTVKKPVTKEIPVTVTKTVLESKVRKASLDRVQAFETDGRAIPLKKLKERLVEDTLVVVSASDKMIPDYYAGLFKPGTIILAFEPESFVQPMPPIAPPAEGIEAPPPQPAANLAAPAFRLVAQTQVAEEDAVELRVPESAPGPVFPKGAAPIFIFASRDGAEHYKLRQTSENSYDTTGYKIKRQGTGRQMVPIKLRQTVRHYEISTIHGKDLQFFTGEGSLLPVERVKERLSREATVLYAGDSEPIDPFWLQNLKSSTLVLVGPQLPGGCGPMNHGYFPVQASPVGPVIPAPAPPPAPVES
jgi:hypothetical protein